MIEWKIIVNNAVSVLVATVFVSAGAIVWTKATTIDETIKEHTADLKVNQEFIALREKEPKYVESSWQHTSQTVFLTAFSCSCLLVSMYDSVNSNTLDTECSQVYSFNTLFLPFIAISFAVVSSIPFNLFRRSCSLLKYTISFPSSKNLLRVPVESRCNVQV